MPFLERCFKPQLQPDMFLTFGVLLPLLPTAAHFGKIALRKPVDLLLLIPATGTNAWGGLCHIGRSILHIEIDFPGVEATKEAADILR